MQRINVEAELAQAQFDRRLALSAWHALPAARQAAIAAEVARQCGHDPRPDSSVVDLFRCVRYVRGWRAAPLASVFPAGDTQLDRLQLASGERPD
jgi:hypothetical protein